MAADCAGRNWACAEKQRVASASAERGERTFMLTGDAGKKTETAMLDENSETALRADVVKVGHHGSKNSAMPGFLAAVHPPGSQ
jgi:beta-lactamase superfamily II metal-dependent hydrolase